MKLDNEKLQLFETMIEEVCNLKEFNRNFNNGFASNGGFYQKAKEATLAYADYCGIDYERAAWLACEYIGC